MHFSLLDLTMNDTCDGMNLAHLTYLMLLHYLAKVETVKMQKCSENCIKCVVYAHHNGPVDYKVWGVMQQCVYETKIYDIGDLQNRLMQTWVDFEQDVFKAAIDQWRDRLRSLCACWWRTL